MTTYKFISDAGHGWLRVKRSELAKLGIADKISTFSYQRGESAYLEEDCDAPLFIEALRAKGLEPKFSESYCEKSRIRGYESYRYETPNEVREADVIRIKMLNHLNWSKKVIKQIDSATLDTLKYWQNHYGF